MQRLMAVFVGTAFIVGSCTASDETARSAARLEAKYVDIGAAGFIDQTVSFNNPGDVALVPRVRYSALDADGNAVPGIDVTAAFGSDRSLLVVPATGYFDVLTFAGDRVAEVVDVDVEILDVATADGYELGQVAEPEALASDGSLLTKFDAFSQVALTNSSEEDAYFRVVCLVYDSPAPGNAQQAVEVSVVVEATLVAAGRRAVLPVSAAFAARTARLGYGCDSLKLHPTPPTTA
ncbi:MAG: hypothetical protein U0Q03_11240 [Acidimicrobiales bacterium]